MKRTIGSVEGSAAGPTLVCIAGIHGNEPSGVAALERVFAALRERETPLAGSFVGLAGNLRALDARVRYVAKDLNRQWTTERMSALDGRGGANGDAPSVSEDLEQRELHAALLDVFARARGRVTVLDLHSASSKTPPFLIFGDTLRNRDFALNFPTPIVLGLEEQIVGTIMEWVSSLGHVALALEAGQHADPISVERHVAAIWLALVAAGVVERAHAPDPGAARAKLEGDARGIPRILEIVDRHAITPEDRFAMKPGYENFDPVQEGEVLATDRAGDVRASGSFRLLFPLYQQLGEDGYFLSRPVNAIWLAVSTLLRKSRVAALAPLLPGVARHPRRRDTLVIDRGIARFWVREVFHLLGYRIEASRGTRMIVKKRDVA